MKRTIYLDAIPLEEALEKWREALRLLHRDRPLTSENVRVIDSRGRVTAEAIFARISSPSYHAAAMDGYAVRFSETFGASETKPILLEAGMQAVPVNTGDPLPEAFNAVIMIEDVNVVRTQGTVPLAQGGKDEGELGPEYVEIIAPATPWQHVRTIGEDIVATELIVPENHRIRSVDIGALLAGGHVGIAVRKIPKVAIIPTGDEIIEPGTEPRKGNIIEFNSRMLAGLTEEWGAEPVRFPIVPDDIGALKKALGEACDVADIVVVNAGSSAGTEDFTAHVVKELGEIVVHGVGIKPGRPVILGIVRGKPVLGIPGYPVSAYITFDLFVRPLIFLAQGLKQPDPETLEAVLSRQVSSALGQEEFLRVKVGVVGEKTIATPVGKGAGVIMSLVRADGIVRIPSLSEGIGAGTVVTVELMRPRGEIRNTAVCIGSHDNTLDVLANFMRKRFPVYSLSSAHVGSLGGLIALKRGEAHFAGSHLLDEETGEYNVAFIRRVLPEKRTCLVNLVYREQGLLVKKGNPKSIRGFEDLVREDVLFINRQSGAGTRLLADKHLRELGLDPSHVRGYEREEYTHMGVASAVSTGIADTGLAILAAARALDLDFIPVAKERYDLVIPSAFLDLAMIQALLTIIRNDEEFRKAVVGLGGYDISDMGKVLYEG